MPLSESSTRKIASLLDTPPVQAVLAALGELDFGTVEVTIHEGQITEVRQTKRSRFPLTRDGAPIVSTNKI